MKDLAEDQEEFSDEVRLRRWAKRMRRAAWLADDDASCWVVCLEQDRVNGVELHDHAEVWLSPSPEDALSFAEHYAEHRGARRDGIGRWTLEVFGDGENSPLRLVVRPWLDEGYPPEGHAVT